MADYKLNIDLQQGISGVKDLTASIDKLNQSIEQLGQKMNSNMAKTTTSTRATKKSMSELNAELEELNQKLQKAKDKHPFTRGRQKEIGDYNKRIKDVNTQIDRLKQKTDNAAAAQARLNKQVSLGRQLFLRLKSVMLTVFGAYAIIQGIRNTINTVKDFELGMARVQAITGATADEMQRLAGVAKVLATQGIFDPTQIAEVEVQLAKFGFTVTEITESLEGVIKLATATGEELSGSATLVSSSLRALGLEADQTQRLVDVLGKSFTSSALDINKFREAAKFVLPLAREMGWTIEEVAATLGKLADAGISGSLAGTGLRQTFIQLWDASSGLSQILGEGIRTFDDFFKAIEESKEEGVSFEELLSTIPVRAKTMFTVLYNNIDAIRDFKDELDDSNGAIDEMANIQLNTLAGQLNRFKSAWDSLVVSLQGTGGWVTAIFKEMADALERARAAIDPFSSEIFKGAERARMSIAEINDNLKEFGIELDDERYKGEFAEDLSKKIKLVEDRLEKLKSNVSTDDNGIALVNMSVIEAFGSVEKFNAVLAGTEEELRVLKAALVASSTEVDNLNESVGGAGETLLKVQQNILSLEEKNMVLRAKRIQDEQAREEQLLGIKNFFEIERLKLLLNYGDLTAEQEALIREQILELERTFQHDLLDLRQGFIDESLDADREAAEQSLKLQELAFEKRLEEMKNAGASEQEIQRETLKFQIQVLKAQILIAKAFGATADEIAEYALQIDILATKLDGITDDETVDDVEKNTKKIADAYRRLAEEILDSLSTIADAQVENTERLVDDLNNRIAETQRALDQEIELYAAGYASNVTAKREELTQLQAARAEAEKDREAAIRRQQQLEAISQAASLFTAVANTVKIYSGIPGVGLGIAAAVVAGFLALFKQSQAQVKNITQFGGGGEIDGNSHARGGVMIEAEGGEFVVRKSAYAKYAPLVKAINDDDVPTINKHILSNTTFDRKGDKVVVDNKIWNKMYDLWEKNLGGENVQIVGTKKIVSRGIKKRIINV